MYTVIAYELSDEKLDFNHYIEIERVTFESEQDAMDWADDMGYLDHHAYSVSIEDENGNVDYL